MTKVSEILLASCTDSPEPDFRNAGKADWVPSSNTVRLDESQLRSPEEILLPLQRVQLAHDEAVHRDILSFSLHTRLKHMVLHFFKYAGRIEGARSDRSGTVLSWTLIDTFIICMASANAMNLSLGASLDQNLRARDLDDLAAQLGRKDPATDVFAEAVSRLVSVGGLMAKVVESADHMEEGNPRGTMASLVPQLTQATLSLLGQTQTGIEEDFRARLLAVERKSIFTKRVTSGQ